jgi:hypothetical protein
MKPVSELRRNVVFSPVPPFKEPPTNVIFKSTKLFNAVGMTS